jgi:hypothetical protein
MHGIMNSLLSVISLKLTQAMIIMCAMIVLIINMVVAVKQNSYTHLRVLLVLTDSGILGQ